MKLYYEEKSRVQFSPNDHYYYSVRKYKVSFFDIKLTMISLNIK